MKYRAGEAWRRKTKASQGLRVPSRALASAARGPFLSLLRPGGLLERTTDKPGPRKCLEERLSEERHRHPPAASRGEARDQRGPESPLFFLSAQGRWTGLLCVLHEDQNCNKPPCNKPRRPSTLEVQGAFTYGAKPQPDKEGIGEAGSSEGGK